MQARKWMLGMLGLVCLTNNVMAAQPMVSGNNAHAVAVASNGTVWAWGRNFDGQLGDGSRTNRKTPVAVSGISNVTTVAAGDSFTLARKTDGTVWAWGYNAIGQLGTGGTATATSPVQTSNLSGVISVGAGYYHGIALKSDGTVWSWGANDNGQLGTGNTIYTKVPVQVSGLTGVTAIASGQYHNVALKADGTVWCWGGNTFGQLGNGSNTDSLIPAKVNGLAGITAIAAGLNNSQAIKSDGTLWAWGLNSTGQAGNGRDNNALVSTPGQVVSLTTVSALAAGGSHVVAVQPGGAVWAWGGNNWGEIGINGNTSYYLSPQAVTRVNNAVAVGAGAYFAVIIKNDGSVWSWGANDEGQLGNNSNTNSSVPVQVLGVGGQGTLNLGSSTGTLMGTDCLFNWAETHYANLLSPAGTPSATLSSYYYRPYAGTSAYLGVSSTDGKLYYIGPASNNAILDLGPFSTWLVTAGCQ